MIREIIPEDLDRLVAIEEECFRSEYADKMMTREEFAEALKCELFRVLCLISGDRVVGYASLQIAEDRTSADFDSLAVESSYQGKGGGEALFKSVEAHCRQFKIPRLNLEIKETNYALLSRYHKFGYKCFAIEENFYEGEWAAIRMKKFFSK